MILRIHSKPRKHTRFYGLIMLLTCLVFARYGLQIGVPRVLLTATIFLIAALGDKNEILAVAMCCIPMHEAVDFSYALVACAAIYALKYQQDIRINFAVLLVLLIIFWELLHCFGPDFSLMSFLFPIVPLIFLAVLLCTDVSRIDYAFIVRVMTAATIVTCTALMINLFVRANYQFASAVAALQRLGQISKEELSDTAVGSAINPNSLGIICVLSLSGLLQLRAVGQSRKSDIILMVIMLVLGSLTASRTFLVCLVIMAILMILGQPGDIRKKIRLLAVFLILLIVALILLNWLFTDLLEYYISRFQSDNIMSSRDTLMTAYHRYISENPAVMFFGIGRSNYNAKLTETYRIARNIPQTRFRRSSLHGESPA